MYRVLLCDDEIHVCQLVQYLVDWDALGLELVGIANSGVEAFEMLTACSPHIVISDIRMSGYSGIDLLEKARERGFHCRFVLISGYREFEYAQKAIQLGVTDYVVKPLKKNDLENALRKAVAELADQSVDTADSGGSKGDHPKHDRERLLADWQGGALDDTRLTRAHLSEQYAVDLSGACCALSWHFLCYSVFSEETLRLLEGKVCAYLDEQANEWFREHLLLRQDSGLILLCACDTAAEMPGLRLMLDGCRAVLALCSGWDVSLGAAFLHGEETLDSVIARAESAAYEQLFDPTHSIHKESANPRNDADFHTVIDFDACGRLSAAIQILDSVTVRAEIESCFSALAQSCAAQAAAVFGYAGWVIGTMNHALSAFDIGADVTRYLDRAVLERELRHVPDVLRIGRRLGEAAATQIETVREAVRSAENRPIRQVKELVAAHYMEPLSLNEVATAVNLNPVYLSVLFKKETGTNFKDYLTGVRIETAKALLRDGESMLTAAEKVGYKDAKYFSKLFTRVVGVNPTQYKKLYL